MTAGAKSTQHPVWSVYDRMRTARLNVKYFGRRLQAVERTSFCLDVILFATAPSSAVAGLWFWHSDYGQIAWNFVAVPAAAAAVVKPLLNLTKRIKDYEGVLAGYRTLEFDLMEIKTMIEQKQSYDQAQEGEFRKALTREKALVAKNPEPRENIRVKKACEAEVLKELPPEAFFVPGVDDGA